MDLIEKTRRFVKETLRGAEGGHDWWHIERVYALAVRLAREENVDEETVKLAALLHDISDAKFNGGDETRGARMAADFLRNHQVAEEAVGRVIHIINHISFRKGNPDPSDLTPELKVVMDADRLDAMGAIGIARAFNYGGFKNRLLYDPDHPPKPGMTPEEYSRSESNTVNHFYEKLLLLRDKMHTVTGRRLAAERHRFMEAFLERFFAEWNGEK